jgi:ribosome-associated toxin RatA of RatAB toxin-antitoxin module
MREVRRHALVPHTAAQMYAIVDAIERYPEFVPWCRTARVSERTPTTVVGTLQIHQAGFHARLTTRNSVTPNRRIELTQVEGPLRRLEGGWSFTPIPESGPEQGSRVALDVRFEFRNFALGVVLGRRFEALWDSLVDAFVARARALYGAGHV